ncbi:S-layer protein [Thermococcus sp.]|uniref:S-layer protein n=1 Tax=Thermococcus sp. TaxID=35749 RepID=UPI0026020DFF|nr:S-layer protein [Thermococcus sp.]
MKVKKIAALAIGAAMIGATMGFASAQPTVPNIPKSFFVNPNGTPNVKIVVGSNAAAMDVASAADIAVALGSLLYTEKEVQAQGDYVKITATYAPATEAMWTIYAYNYTTITEDHNITNITSWATSYDQLPGDYWYNGAAFTANYTTWKENFNVPTTLKGKDKSGDYTFDWHITISHPSLMSTNPSNWNQTAPPKSADIAVAPGQFHILVDYVLYNYSVTTTETVTLGKPEWGTTTETKNVTNYYIGDKEEMEAAGATNGTVVFQGIGAGDTFTVFGQEYHVLSVGNNNFTAGHVAGDQWYQVGQPQAIPGTNWVVNVLDISITDQRALVTVKNTETGAETDQIILSQGQPIYICNSDGTLKVCKTFPSTGQAALLLKLEDTFVGIDGHLIASIYAEYDIANIGPTFHPVSGWNATVSTSNGYITNISLVNAKELEGNPLDIFGTYNLMYKYVQKSYDEYYNPASGEFVKAPSGKSFIVAYAYICLKDKKGKVVEKEIKVGDQIPGTDFVVSEIAANVTQIELKPVTQPITVMDFEVNMENPGANLILVGGPVANKITKYLVEQNISKVNWYNSTGDIEYIPNALGGKDVVIVAGANRTDTRMAAEALMKYIAELVKE